MGKSLIIQQSWFLNFETLKGIFVIFLFSNEGSWFLVQAVVQGIPGYTLLGT